MRNKLDSEPIVSKLVKVIHNRVPLIGAGGLDTIEDIEEALNLGYDLVALGMITIADKDAVLHLKNNQKPHKVISKDSLLPTPLYNRIKQWRGIEEKGYQVK